MTPALSLVHTRANTRRPVGEYERTHETYADIPQAARDEFFRLKAAVDRMGATFAGSYATTVKRDQAISELPEVSALALSVQRYLRRGR